MNEVMKAASAETLLPADPMVTMIERVVMDPNADIGKLEKMLEMRERIEARESRRAFDRAIAAAKSQIQPIIKTGIVSYGEGQKKTEFKHETLDGIALAVDPILSAHGLSYRFRSEQIDGGLLRVTCVVSHRDGHSEETTLQGSRDDSGSKNNYQALGSAATYLQRYTLKLALGLSAANDDDANSASPALETVSPDQYIELRDALEESGMDHAKFYKAFGVSDPSNASLEQFPAKRCGEALTRLKAYKEARQNG